MSDKDKRASKVEGQPLKPLPMPEYRYQARAESKLSGTVRSPDKEKQAKKPDLSGITLNFS